MNRFLTLFALASLAAPALAEDAKAPATPAAKAEKVKEKTEDVRDKLQDVREAETPKERAEEKAELRKDIEELKAAKAAVPEKAPAADKPGIAEKVLAPEKNKPVVSEAKDLRALVAKYAAANGVPADVGHGVVMVESRYNANATGAGTYIGLMQISYPTAKALGYSGDRAGLYDPAVNLQYGMKYFGQAYRLAGGNLCGAVSKYQGGHRVTGVTKSGAVYCTKIRKYMAQAAPAAASAPVLASTEPATTGRAATDAPATETAKRP